jgi:hypothetical protein
VPETGVPEIMRVAEIVALPAATPRTNPGVKLGELSTVAVPVCDDIQLT